MRSAWDLKQSLASIKLYVIDMAGHSMKETGITNKLIELTGEVANNLSNI